MPHRFEFVRDAEIPWHNNAGERAIRSIWVKRKMSGGMRSAVGARTYARRKSVHETTRRKGEEFLRVVMGALTRAPTRHPTRSGSTAGTDTIGVPRIAQLSWPQADSSSPVEMAPSSPEAVRASCLVLLWLGALGRLVVGPSVGSLQDGQPVRLWHPRVKVPVERRSTGVRGLVGAVGPSEGCQPPQPRRRLRRVSRRGSMVPPVSEEVLTNPPAHCSQ